MMTSRVLAEQLSDQAWESMKQLYYVEISRLADGNFENTPEDHFLVRKMATLIRGEISLRILNFMEE